MSSVTVRQRLVGCALVALPGCAGGPPSRFPSGDAALARMHATYECSRGVAADAKIDYFEDNRRVRGSVLYKATLPDQLRFDVFSPFGITVLTLTSDGRRFSLYDLAHKQFLSGAARACNVRRFTRVPVPPFALVQLLRGEAPVLVHAPDSARVEWKSGLFTSSRYVVTVPGKGGTEQEIELAPLAADWSRPWSDQRVRVTRVTVRQGGDVLYAATLDDHQPTHTAKAQEDPDGVEPDVAPSGPPCSAEVPRALRVEVPWSEQDLVLKAKEVEHNPPLSDGVYTQPVPGGVTVGTAQCDD